MVRNRHPFNARVVTLATALSCAAAVGTASAQLDAANAASARSASVESPPSPPDLDGAFDRLNVVGRYVQIPVIGRIGSDVTSTGFVALAQRRKALHGATAFIVEVDSDSGSTEEGLRIAHALVAIGEEVPVILVVRRAIGPAAMLVPAADRVFIGEPALSGTIIAFQPEIDPTRNIDVDDSIEGFRAHLKELIGSSPRGEALQEIVAPTPHWEYSSSAAYKSGVAEPLEGGMSSLGRVLKIDPWISSGRQVEDLLKQAGSYAQALDLYRGRMVARAFASLQTANNLISQIAAAEQSAVSADPRHRPGASSGYRVQRDGSRWSPAAGSDAAWERTCEGAIAAWVRVVQLGESAQQSVNAASVDIGAVVATVKKGAPDPILAEAVDRLERERVDVAARLESVQPRLRAAKDEAAAVEALLRR